MTRDRDLNGQRVNDYYAWYKGNEEQAKQHIDESRSVPDHFPIRGQIKMGLMLVDKLESMLKKT